MTAGAEVAGARSTDLNPARTKAAPTPEPELPDAALDPSPFEERSTDPIRIISRRPTDKESDPLLIVDRLSEPYVCATPSPHLATEHGNDPEVDKQDSTTIRERWARIWPSLLAVGTLSAVGGPAAVASYRHARDVIAEHGDPVMSPWLALTTDGMLLAALVVIWVRRHRSEDVKTGPWAAFWAGMAATMAANLAAAQPTPVGIIVALWPPVCLAITLELVALVATRAKPHPPLTDPLPAEPTAGVPIEAQPTPGHVPTAPPREDRAPQTGEAGHDTGPNNGHLVGEMPAEAAGETSRAPTAVPEDPNGHTPVPAPAVPAPDLRDLSGSTGRVPPPAGGHRSGIQPGHEAGQNGHHGMVRTGRVPDRDILAWLREQAYTTGQVPGRRKVIEKWAPLGSTRADRLRRSIIDESAHKNPDSAG